MAKRMLIDATHPEETRVVVLNGNRLEEFDFESSTKQQVKGNIYLAKVTRVEPSLQAAFVEYGGNRHGFLAFSEIHPDYFRIPVGDRDATAGGSRHEEANGPESVAEAAEDTGVPLATALPDPVAVVEAPPGLDDPLAEELGGVEQPSLAAAASDGEPDEEKTTASEQPAGAASAHEPPWVAAEDAAANGATSADHPATPGATADGEATSTVAEAEARADAARGQLPWEDVTPFVPAAPAPDHPPSDSEPLPVEDAERAAEPIGYAALRSEDYAVAHAPMIGGSEWAAAAVEDDPLAEPGATTSAPQPVALVEGENGETEIIETIGGDEIEEAEHQRSRALRHYKIQEVIKRRQIMLVQVTKEERGNKGAALTTYLSLAGRYCVLMPNTARGGGVSRKITSITDRRRLKDILEDLDIPEGMGVIVRTAGAERSKAEIKRDYEYLLRLWNEIRELTLQSTAPASIYEEGNLIKRSIRDLYTRDIDEVLVEGDDGYRTAKAFMKMLMPSHAKRVQPYRDPQIGLLHRFQVEGQIDAIHSPIVQLRSGGYVVINQTEALVAIDVNSGRSTRERNIEETALRTNLEAAEEIARQLRLRDLAGLIVIDFIDMEEHRNQGAVERRLKEALKNDRARIQVGRISPFGLLEMSRQRLRPSLVEASTQPCPHCGGTGFIRSTESTALYVLRSIEEEGMRRRSAEVCVYVPTTVALYILNHKRDSLAQLEARYGVHVLVARDDALVPPAFRLERLRAYEAGETAPVAMVPLTQAPDIDEEESGDDDAGEREAAAAGGRRQDDDDERGRNRRRRRRRRRHDDERGGATAVRAAEEDDEPADEALAAGGPVAGEERDSEAELDETQSDEDKLRRRRGRRGGRRRARRDEATAPSFDDPRPTSETVEIAATTGASELEDGGAANDEAEPASAPALSSWVGDAPAEADGGATSELSAAGEVESAAEAEAPSPPPAANGAMPSQAVAEPEAPAPSGVFADHEEPEAVLLATHGDPQATADAGTEPRVVPPAENAVEPPVTGQEQHDPNLVVIPTVLAPEKIAEPQPESEPAVQSVTEKPASPRKGWWQRLIQS